MSDKPTAEDSRALLAEYDRLRVRSTLSDHLRAALDREAAALALTAKNWDGWCAELIERKGIEAERDELRDLWEKHWDKCGKAEAERDAALAEVERLTGALTAANDISTVRAIEIIMARLKMDQETQRIMRAQLHHARAARAALAEEPGA